MLNLIDVEPMHPGWGKVYQSGMIASEDWENDGLIVSMIGNTNFRGPCFWISMPDTNEDVLPDDHLKEMVEAIMAFLKNGTDVLIHCLEGKYRSTYMDVAVHIAGGMSFEVAFEQIIARHPIAQLREGCASQLKRMEPILRGD